MTPYYSVSVRRKKTLLFHLAVVHTTRRYQACMPCTYTCDIIENSIHNLEAEHGGMRSFMSFKMIASHKCLSTPFFDTSRRMQHCLLYFLFSLSLLFHYYVILIFYADIYQLLFIICAVPAKSSTIETK